MWNVDQSCDAVPLAVEQLKATHLEVWRHAHETEEKVSDEVELDACATMLGLVERGKTKQNSREYDKFG